MRLYLKTLCALLVISLMSLTHAQQDVVWRGDYFDNPYLIGPSVVTRDDNSISFDWGAGAPIEELPDDNFSVRWGADPFFAEGNYRFYALADDNVRITVDYANTPIDTFNTPSVGQVITGEVFLEAGRHHIQVDYRERTGNAFVYVGWANLDVNPNPVLPNFPAPQTNPIIQSGAWIAEYFPNSSLIGPATVIRTEITPSHNWGVEAPAVGFPADNFSARWTSVQILNGGNYQITARADDGIRVSVDGVRYIDAWQVGTGIAYSPTLNLTPGQHTFVVEYFEATGLASLEFNLIPVGVTPQISSSTTGTVVTALRLNVRDAPSVNGAILTKVSLGETFPVIGRNADQTWWQINVNGTIGWVFDRFFDVESPVAVPITSFDESPVNNQPPLTGFRLITLDTVNVRSSPTEDSAILGQIAPSRTAPIVGRNADNSWYQVNYRGITGWVNGEFVRLPADIDINGIPLTG